MAAKDFLVDGHRLIGVKGGVPGQGSARGVPREGSQLAEEKRHVLGGCPLVVLGFRRNHLEAEVYTTPI